MANSIQDHVKTGKGPVKGVTNDLLFRILTMLRKVASQAPEAGILGDELELIVGNRLALASRAGQHTGQRGRVPSWYAVEDDEADTIWRRGLVDVAELLGRTMQSVNVAMSRAGGSYYTTRSYDGRDIIVRVRRASPTETERLEAAWLAVPDEYHKQPTAPGSYSERSRGRPTGSKKKRNIQIIKKRKS